MNGYAGHVLEIDLTRRKSKSRPLDDRLLQSYLGGRGLAVRLLWDALPAARVNALSPDNAVVLATGPFTGFPITGASRTTVVTKSPATSPRTPAPGASTLAIGQMPGHFASELKYAGYDAVVLRGRASEPLCLVIRDDDVDFRPSSELWGKEIPEAEKEFRAALPREPYQTLMIGPAGERLVPLASAVHNFPCSSHAGRGGIGAVLGSKNLKGIAVRGTLQPFDVANPKGFEDLGRRWAKSLESWNQFEAWRRWGTAALVEAGNDQGLLAVNNFREGTFAKIQKIGAVRAEAAFWTRSEACFYCPLHCRKVALLHGKGDVGAVAGPELETSVMLGSNCGVDELAGVLAVKKRCDALGLDPSSTGNLLGFLMEAAEKRLVTPSDVANLSWGNAKAMAAFLEAVAHGEGKAATFSRGVRAAAKAIGGGSEGWAMEVKGLEMDTYNAPAMAAMVVVFGTSPTGAAHEMGHSPEVQNQRALSDSLGLCRFHTYANGPEAQAALYTAVTGVARTPVELVAIGERIWNLERAFLSREGFEGVDDHLPARTKTDAFSSGPKKGSVLTEGAEGKLLADYYKARGWDAKTAAPQPATLQRLGLAELVPSTRPG